MKFVKVSEDEELKMPRRATEKSAGYDFFSPVNFSLMARQSMKIPLGIKVVDMPKDVVLLIFNRSGLALNKGLTIDNAVGVIDADYDDQIWFQATARQSISMSKNDRICQGVFVHYLTVDDDDADGERNGGLGSTGE